MIMLFRLDLNGLTYVMYISETNYMMQDNAKA